MGDTVLKHETSVKAFIGEKPKYSELTAVSDKEMGEFLVTNSRIIFFTRFSFARALGGTGIDIASLLSGIPAGMVLSELLASKASNVEVKPEMISKIMEEPSSFQIPLTEIIKTEAKKAYIFTNYLTITYRTSTGTEARSFVFGSAAKSKKELADFIDATRRDLSTVAISQPASTQSSCPSCGKPLTYITQYQRWYCYNCQQYA